MFDITNKTRSILERILNKFNNTFPGPGVFGLFYVENLCAINTDRLVGFVTSFGLYVEGPGVVYF